MLTKDLSKNGSRKLSAVVPSKSKPLEMTPAAYHIRMNYMTPSKIMLLLQTNMIVKTLFPIRMKTANSPNSSQIGARSYPTITLEDSSNLAPRLPT